MHIWIDKKLIADLPSVSLGQTKTECVPNTIDGGAQFLDSVASSFEVNEK